MTRRLIIGFALFTLVLVAGGLCYYLARQTPGQTLPSLSPRGGDTSASTEFLNAQRAAAFYRDEIQKHPEVVKNYVELAQLFLQEARVTANHHEYIPKAQYLLDEALLREPENFEAIITRASVLMTLHHFDEARMLAEKAIATNPYSSFAYGALCDAYVELGHYANAVKTCDKMLSVRPDLRSYSRASYLRELHGDVEGASDAMKLAADAGIFGQENRAWVLFSLGNLYLHEGKLDTAEYIYKGILEERPNYAYAFSGLAQVLAARGETGQAIIQLARAMELTPEHLFLEQLADLYRATGQMHNAAGTARLVIESYLQHEGDGWNTDKEYALFCANHDMNLDEALDRARRDYERRPENIDALDVYAWTLYKNGKPSEALPFVEKALRLNTRSAIMEYHAGVICQAAGMPKKASYHLRKTIGLNPFPHVLYAADAKARLASLDALAFQN